TGEHRKYDSSSGVLGAVRVDRPCFSCRDVDDDRPHGWGAWELAARFSYLDFADSDTPAGPNGQPIGLRLAQATSGANWYPSDQVRLMFTSSYAVPDEPNTGTSTANIFGTRLAVFW